MKVVVESCVHGYHVYQIWTPVIGEHLNKVNRLKLRISRRAFIFKSSKKFLSIAVCDCMPMSEMFI